MVVVAVTHVVYEAEGWGVGELVAEDGRVVWHELPRPRRPHDGLRALAASQDPSQTPTHPGRGAVGAVLSREVPRADRSFLTEVVRLVQTYLAGRAPPEALREVPLDLEYETEFSSRCADALRAVPRGEVVTYGELAALAAAPGAARAAGSFCARNRLGLFVPCHRVVSAGGLGSYGSLGLAYKRRLLALEGWPGAL
jgi:O-6-methylguanine DNA methyltransferase